MPEALWKLKEMAVAEKLGGVRYGIQRPGVVDVVAPGLALEVVMRKKMPRVEVDALNIARRYAGPARLGGVVRTLTGSDMMYIMFELDDFCEWFVNSAKEKVSL